MKKTDNAYFLFGEKLPAMDTLNSEGVFSPDC
jgi:hypothetical protein